MSVRGPHSEPRSALAMNWVLVVHLVARRIVTQASRLPFCPETPLIGHPKILMKTATINGIKHMTVFK